MRWFSASSRGNWILAPYDEGPTELVKHVYKEGMPVGFVSSGVSLGVL